MLIEINKDVSKFFYNYFKSKKLQALTFNVFLISILFFWLFSHNQIILIMQLVAAGCMSLSEVLHYAKLTKIFNDKQKTTLKIYDS